ACKYFAVFGNTHNVAAALANARAGNHDNLSVVAVELADRNLQPPGSGCQVNFSFDDNSPGDNVQSAAEAEHGRNLSLADRWLANLYPRQLVFDGSRQCHESNSLTWIFLRPDRGNHLVIGRR